MVHGGEGGAEGYGLVGGGGGVASMHFKAERARLSVIHTLAQPSVLHTYAAGLVCSGAVGQGHWSDIF